MIVKRDMITQSTVLERPGWSRTLVKRLLGEPDQRKKCPGRKRLMCLYALERVEQCEKTEAFLTAQASLAKRVMAAEKGVATKTARLLADIDAMVVEVRTLDERELLQRSIQSYNQRLDVTADDYMPPLASLDSDPEFLQRICVNYIRHELTRYDRMLSATAGKTGIASAVDAIRTKVYAAISAAYPALTQECDWQLMVRRADIIVQEYEASAQ